MIFHLPFQVLGEYDFGYSEGHLSGSTFRRESGDALGNKIGSYGQKLADGRVRIVNYIADKDGFRVYLTSNEPGVSLQEPASVAINKPAVLPFNAAPVVPIAPVAAVPPPLPPPPPPAPVVVPSKIFPPPPPPPPPVSYNYLRPAPVAIPPPPPPAYFPPPSYVAPVPAPIVPAAKSVAAYPPPPPAYYSNVIPGKGFVNAVNTYTSLLPPFAAVPPQFNYLSLKAPPPYQTIGVPL